VTEPDGLPGGKRALLEPPFCRGNELADIVSAIRTEGSRAVFLTSDSGLGASTILRELAAAAREHVPVLAIHGSQSLAKIPYGVMTPYLAGVSTGEASVRMSMLRAVLAELRRLQAELAPDGRSGEDLPIIIIDDAHSMDPASAELVVSLVRSGMATLVASHSSRHRLPEPLPALWMAGMAENIVLRPLDQAQAHAFCEAMLGGPVLPATGWHYWSTSGGNPLFLRLLLAQAQEQGLLTKRGGVWVGDPDASIHGHDLEEAVRRQLRGLSGEGLEALNLIALSEPVDDSTIQDVVGAAGVRELLDWHLVHYGTPPSRLLSLANPVYGEVIREMVPVTQSRLLHERLIGRLDGGPVNKEALLRRVLWAVEIGAEVPDESLLSAAILASRMFQSATALDLANQIRGGEFRLQAAMVKARAHYNLGDYQGALSLMEAGHGEAGNLPDLLFGSLLRAATRSALGMPVASLAADAATLRDRGAELARSRPEEADSLQALSESGALLVELMALSRQGRYSEMAGLTALLTSAGGLSEAAMRLNRTMALTMDSERLIAQGFPQQGMERAAQAYAIEHSEENDVFFLPETILLRLLAAAMCCGDWQGAARTLEEFSLDAGPVVFSFGGGANVVRGMAFLRGGKVADALEILLAGIDALRISDPQQLLGFCTAMAAYAAARLGTTELARQLVDAHVEGTGMFVVVSHERAYLAGARYLLGNDAGAPVELVALADAALADRSTTLELNALAIALELGDESVVPRLGRVAATVEGTWAHALCQYARALECGDGQLLAAAGESLGAAGLFGFAEQALEKSISLLRENGPRGQVRAARSSLRKVAEGMGVRAPGALRSVQAEDPTVRQPPALLTRRERQVSTLAAAGRSDREIAAELTLSLRTVEGHLYRAYAKLGISSREDLPEAMANTEAG
jgi:DNA-binding CsgD family transcriptional regulator